MNACQYQIKMQKGCWLPSYKVFIPIFIENSVFMLATWTWIYPNRCTVHICIKIPSENKPQVYKILLQAWTKNYENKLDKPS